MRQLFPKLTFFEWMLWSSSVLAIVLSYCFFPQKDLLSCIGSLVGVTALIFIAKGAVVGQILMVLFALFYGFHSLHYRYYGEMLTYLGMSAPAALFNVYSWLRHPYQGHQQVEVASLSKKHFFMAFFGSIAVAMLFYFLLREMGTAKLLLSTFSVATSFFAAFLSFFRSPWFAIGYVANDIVLIFLWARTVLEAPSTVPVLVCFCVFLLNDLNSFFSWQKMKRNQQKAR